MARVWAYSSRRGSDLLMMLAIADFADDEGNAYPAVPTLAQKCRMSDRNANHILVALRAAGELEIRHSEGPKGTNRYRIVLPELEGVKRTSPPRSPRPLTLASPPTPEAGVSPEAGIRVKPVAEGGEAGSSNPLKPASDEPSGNHHGPSVESARALHTADAFMPDVDAQVLNDWLQVRKARKAGPITKTAADKLRKEAEKAGLTLQEAVEVCCHRGWQSFNAGWNWRDTNGSGQTGRALLDSEDVFRGCK